MDICDCRVAFATENVMNLDDLPDPLQVYCQCCRCGESRIWKLLLLSSWLWILTQTSEWEKCEGFLYFF